MDIKAMDQLQAQIDKYDIQVGVFDNIPRKKPINGKNGGVSTLAGGPIRKTRPAVYPSMSMEVAEDLQAKFHWLDRPFRASNEKSKDIVRFTDYFIASICKEDRSAAALRRISNLIQAIVRNPITRGDYGRNSAKYAKVKGFNRLLFDTGQFFKSIVGKVK